MLDYTCWFPAKGPFIPSFQTLRHSLGQSGKLACASQCQGQSFSCTPSHFGNFSGAFSTALKICEDRSSCWWESKVNIGKIGFNQNDELVCHSCAISSPKLHLLYFLLLLLLFAILGPTYNNRYPLGSLGDLSIACLIIPKGKRANHEVLARFEDHCNYEVWLFLASFLLFLGLPWFKQSLTYISAKNHIAAVLGCSIICNLKPSSPITSKQDRRKGILQDSRDQQQWCNLKLKAMATGWVNYGQLSPSQDPLILRTRPLPSMTCQTAHQMTRSRTTYANALALLHVWRSRCSSLVMYVWNYVKQLKVRSLSLTFINMVWTFKMHSFHLMWRSFCGPPVPWRVEFPWPGL